MDENFILTGTREPAAGTVTLRAGPLTVELDKGNLRTIRHDGAEILRAIAYVVRDRDWGTYDPEIRNLAVDQAGGRFSVTYQGACTGPDGAALVFDVSIDGASDGSLVFDVRACPDGDFETNRCGFCILHPIAGLAGAPVTVEHVDGSIAETTMPELIDPWQPFKDMRAITTPVRHGIIAECRMEGDTFEMEDQRNWSDASYKTYVRPLAQPWPYRIRKGETIRQSVSLRFHAEGAAKATPRAEARTGGQKPVRVWLGEEGPAVPAIGVVIYETDTQDTLARIETLRALAPQRMLFHFDPLAGNSLPALQGFAALARAYPAETTLEIALPCRRDPGVELAEMAGLVQSAGLKPDAVMVSPAVDRQSTPPGSAWPDCPPLENVYAAARRAFPAVKLGGGMLSYFTELNRKRVPPGQLDFVTHCTCPIVHAADDLSVMQSLEALPFITRSVRAIYGDMPYRIGPSTIAMRQNPYGGATKDNPALTRIAMADRDPRHGALFAAAWAVGYAARTVAAGLEQLVPSALAGPFGLIAADGEPMARSSLRPLYHVVHALARLAGNPTLTVGTERDDALACIAARKAHGPVVLVANLTPHPLAIDCPDIAAMTGDDILVLDADAVATRPPGGFLGRSLESGAIELGPYAVARFGPAL